MKKDEESMMAEGGGGMLIGIMAEAEGEGVADRYDG